MLSTKRLQRAPDLAPSFTRLTDLRRVIMLTLYATPAQRTEIVYAMGWLYERMEFPIAPGTNSEDWYAGVVQQLLADMERVGQLTTPDEVWEWLKAQGDGNAWEGMRRLYVERAQMRGAENAIVA